MNCFRVVVALTIAVVLAGCGTASPMTPSSEPVVMPPEERRVVVIGDSYTEGSAEGGRGADSWPALVWGKMRRNYTPVVAHVAAEGGAGYVQPGQQGHVFIDLLDGVVDVNTDLVVFFGSRNDGLAPPGELESAARDTFAKAKEMAPAAQLLVIGPVWPSPEIPAQFFTMRDVLRVQAEQAGGSFVDPLAEGWLQDMPQDIGADGIHPTDEGHKLLAARIEPVIQKALDNLPA